MKPVRLQGVRTRDRGLSSHQIFLLTHIVGRWNFLRTERKFNLKHVSDNFTAATKNKVVLFKIYQVYIQNVKLYSCNLYAIIFVNYNLVFFSPPPSWCRDPASWWRSPACSPTACRWCWGPTTTCFSQSDRRLQIQNYVDQSETRMDWNAPIRRPVIPGWGQRWWWWGVFVWCWAANERWRLFEWTNQRRGWIETHQSDGLFYLVEGRGDDGEESLLDAGQHVGQQELSPGCWLGHLMVVLDSQVVENREQYLQQQHQQQQV